MNEDDQPDEFDELIKHQSETEPRETTVSNLWEGVEHLWSQLHPGVLVKGIIIMEYVDDRGKVLRWQTSPDMTPWDMLGMLHQSILDINSDSIGDSIASHLVGSDEDESDNDDVEDEQ